MPDFDGESNSPNEKKYLAAREANAAVLYADISGFTRVSEQVLQEPSLIGKLIDTWSENVVELIWRTNGVFDKLVGDCVIALWGPPFFDQSARQASPDRMKTTPVLAPA